MRERIEDARAESEQDGFHIRVVTDEEDYDFLVSDVETARTLLREVSRLRSWIEDHDRERAAYNAATPEERQAVIGVAHLDCGVSSDRIDDLRARADDERKRERENRG